MDRVTRRTDPLGREETFNYDANGNLLTATDRKGQTATFTYDRLDRRISSQFADGASRRRSRTTRSAGCERGRQRRSAPADRAGVRRPRSASDPRPRRSGSIRYGYDALGRRTEMLASGAEPGAPTLRPQLAAARR